MSLIGEGESSPQTTMGSKEIFVEALDNLSSNLDNLGFYMVDSNMKILGATEKFTSLDELRSAAINKQVIVSLEVDCFMGKNAWRNGTNILEDLNIQIKNLADVLGIDVEEEEN